MKHSINLWKRAPVGWHHEAARMTNAQNCEASDSAAAVAVRAARASAYLEYRRRGRTHTAAVRHQNAVAATVRRALGFTYDDKITF